MTLLLFEAPAEEITEWENIFSLSAVEEDKGLDYQAIYKMFRYNSFSPKKTQANQLFFSLVGEQVLISRHHF